MSKTHIVLINRCRKGDEKAMMKIYDLYCEAMFHIACRYLNNEDAKDAMQESFIKAFAKLHMYSEVFSFGSWLKRIVINQCIDTLKKKQLDTVDVELTELDIKEDTNWNFESDISKQQILEAIASLPIKYKLVVKLYLIEGYDHEEISDILNIAIKTSRTQLRRGKLQLQHLLKKTYNEARY